MKHARILKIVVASPGDVQAERDMIPAIVDELNKGIAYLYRQQREIVGERLELYRQLMQQLVTQLDREKNVERFYLPDPDGSLKRDFLKQLAYERLFVDEVDKEAERLILTGEVIAAKARIYCQIHHVANPHLLAADVKASPLLREIGADAYAFAHLTLQEYLAAMALAEQPDCEKIFCCSFFNPTLAEMEVLPMALGLVRKLDDFYAVLEGLPESLNFVNLRLRARGLAYVRHINPAYLNKLKDRLFDFITYSNTEEMPYRDAVINSFAKASGEPSKVIVDHVATLVGSQYKSEIEVLGVFGSESGVDALLLALKDEDKYVRQNAAEALGKIGSERSVEALLLALKDEDTFVYMNAAEALGKIVGERSVDALLLVLKNEDRIMRFCAAEALGKIGSERSVDALLLALKDEDNYVRQNAAAALGKMSDTDLTIGLSRALSDNNSFVRPKAAQVVGYYTTDKQVLATLHHIAASDSTEEERTAAREAAEKYANKLRYFA